MLWLVILVENPCPRQRPYKSSFSLLPGTGFDAQEIGYGKIIDEDGLVHPAGHAASSVAAGSLATPSIAPIAELNIDEVFQLMMAYIDL